MKILQKIMGAGYYALDNIVWLAGLGLFRQPEIYGNNPKRIKYFFVLFKNIVNIITAIVEFQKS